MAAHHRIVSLILRHLSDMKYKDRRQPGPDQPVEFLEFRPTLVPSILVNKSWAEEGTCILWKSYPHLPALRDMSFDRRQYYANKVQRLFVLGPAEEEEEDLAHLEGLEWPQLKTLELEIDWERHGKAVSTMLHAGLENLEFSGPQSGGSLYFTRTIMPALFAPCANLRSIHFSEDVIDPEDPVHCQELIDRLDCMASITEVCVMRANFLGKDILFGRLSQTPGLETLEIDLDPGLQLLPCFSGPNALPTPFAFLKRLHIICYPELALALPSHLKLLEHVELDVARIPNHPRQDSDMNIIDDILGRLTQCSSLQSIRVNIGQLSASFPSASSYPFLSGLALMKLATGCPKLQDLKLLTSEPAAIDGSLISKVDFDTFCQTASQLSSLDLKLHPQTAIDLESTALESLGRHCSRLETLRLRVSLQLPSLQLPRNSLPAESHPVSSQGKICLSETVLSPSIVINDQQGVSSDIDSGSWTPDGPLFPSLTHLAFSRPQSILSIASDTYTISSASQSSSIVDPIVEEDLVKSWAQPLAAHFPRLEVLEAWGDWTGHDNESLNYFLPREELLASTWEFLSGVEQDLWEDEEEQDDAESDMEFVERGVDRFSISNRASGDWELASLVNEYPVEDDMNDNAYTDEYEEEPEDMITPGRTVDVSEDAYFGSVSTITSAAVEAAAPLAKTSDTADAQVI